MARRRTRAKQAPVEEEDPVQEEPAPEPASEQEEDDIAQPGGDEEEEEQQEAGQQATAGAPHEDEEQRVLQFDEELSWRVGKSIPSATLLARLETLSQELADFDQGAVDLESLKDVASKLAHRNLLQHKDRGVRAYTACCLVDILRLFVPEAPFTDDQLKMIFSLFIKDILPALHDPTNPYDSQHKYVLMSLTDVKSILLLTEINGADDLLLRLFNSSFDGVSSSSKANGEEQVAKDVEIHLTDMLLQLIDESPGSVPAAVIDAIISQFLRAAPPGGARSKEQNGNQSTLLPKTEPPAYIMAKNICNGCADKMARYVTQYFSDVILDASQFATKSNGARRGGAADDDDDADDANAGPSEADLKSLRQAHLLIRELWRAAPTVLQNVIPQIDAELSADNVHLRQIATETLGDMVAGIGAAGPPPPPVLDPAAYPPARLLEESPLTPVEGNVLTKPYSPQSFAQAHHGAYRNFVSRSNDISPAIRTAWVTAVGYILSTSAGGIGLSREDEGELISGLGKKLGDNDEKVRLAAVKAIELFDFRDIVLKLGMAGGFQKEGSIFAILGDRCRDRRPAVRVEAMVLLGKLWAVGSGELADGQQAVTACLGGAPSQIIKAFYANDPDLNVLLDRVLYECLVPLRYPNVKGAKSAKSGAASSQLGGGSKSTMSQAEQDRIRAERILLMLKGLDPPAQKAFFAIQARQPQLAKGLRIFLQQCEAYNGGVVDSNEDKVKAGLTRTMQWFGTFFPDQVKVRSDLQKFAKLNDRRSYQLVKYAIESESDFKTVRRAINELITKIQGGAAASSLDTLIPLLYRSSSLMYNRSHLTTIMDYSKNDKDGYAGVAHQILNDISQRNPDLFKAHSEQLQKDIIEQTPSESKANDPAVVDMLKAYSSYAKKYPEDINCDRKFTQTLMDYAQYGTPAKTAKYAVNILLSKNDDKSKVTATTLLRKTMKDCTYDSPRLLNKLTTISQLARLAPTVMADSGDAINDLTIKDILRQVRTDAKDSDPSWVDDADMDNELQAKCLSLKVLVNQALADEDEAGSEDRIKALVKLLKNFVVKEGEFCKVKDTPKHHKKRLRLLAGQLLLKLSTVKKYDDQLDHATFDKLAEMIQDGEPRVRRHFAEKLQNYLTRGRLRARFYTILFLAAFEPDPDMKQRIESWLRSRAQHYAENGKQVLEAVTPRLISLLAHHPDYSLDVDYLLDFAKYFIFYLNIVATEENVSLIYKYAERVKQTRDGINPEASENLYVVSDLAQTVIRNYQERRNWSFQAYAGKVGLPSGLFTTLPSSEVAQQIAKKLYIPEELDEKVGELIRALDRKKKRKSMHDGSEQPAKKAKTQIKTVVREKKEPRSRVKSDKASRKKTPARPKKTSSPLPPLSERRRSGRSHAVSTYKERDDEDDEAEMMDGVAEWDYGDDGSDEESGEEASGSENEDGGSDNGAGEGSENNDDDEPESEAESETEEPPRSVRKKAAPAPAKSQSKTTSRPAVKPGVLGQSSRSSRATRTRGARDTSDMDVDDE